MSPQVRIERDGAIAVVIIDNPPVNTASYAVRLGILEAVAALGADPDVVAVVLIGAGKSFVAGSDLREFGLPLADPQLPTVIKAIEDCPKTVVAALHGATLGGGYELALGCDARIAAPETVLGLPEVSLGMVPGAGGTQRLPRLVGVSKAIELICGAERVDAREALDLGMVDRIAEESLRLDAVRYARCIAGTKNRVRDMRMPAEPAQVIEQAVQAALHKGCGQRRFETAIDLVRMSTAVPIDKALALERSAFQALRVSDEAFALRHLFFAERESAKRPEFYSAKAREISRVAIVGAGTMGVQIALCFLGAGFEVALFDASEEALEQASQRIRAHYAGRVESGKLDPAQAEQEKQRLILCSDEASVCDAQLIVEAVFEDIETKKSVFGQLDRLAQPSAILASNTSYLDVDEIAEATTRPQDVVGLHFFAPANVMRLLEVVRGAYTSAEVLATCFSVARRLGKLPILSRNTFGFIGNRIFAAYRRECEYMLEEGALPVGVDQALKAFGFAMGPFEVADLSGLDVAWRMRQARPRAPGTRYVEIPDQLCELKRYGRKAGAGYYAYPDGSEQGVPDPVVEALIVAASRTKGVSRREISADEIVSRALLSMVNEAAILLGEGTTARVGDIDLAMVNGFGFPRWRGGPVFWACMQDPAELERGLDRLAAAHGHGFVRGDISLLRRMLPEDRTSRSSSAGSLGEGEDNGSKQVMNGA